jgi:hypothetical protein
MRAQPPHQISATTVALISDRTKTAADLLAIVSGRMEALADLLAGGAPARHVVNRLREEAAGIDAAITGRCAMPIDGGRRE